MRGESEQGEYCLIRHTPLPIHSEVNVPVGVGMWSDKFRYRSTPAYPSTSLSLPRVHVCVKLL